MFESLRFHRLGSLVAAGVVSNAFMDALLARDNHNMHIQGKGRAGRGGVFLTESRTIMNGCTQAKQYATYFPTTRTIA